MHPTDANTQSTTANSAPVHDPPQNDNSSSLKRQREMSPSNPTLGKRLRALQDADASNMDLTYNDASPSHPSANPSTTVLQPPLPIPESSGTTTSQPDGIVTLLNTHRDAATGTNAAASPHTPKKGRGPRGPYKPRQTPKWEAYFRFKRPTLQEDDSFSFTGKEVDPTTKLIMGKMRRRLRTPSRRLGSPQAESRTIDRTLTPAGTSRMASTGFNTPYTPGASSAAAQTPGTLDNQGQSTREPALFPDAVLDDPVVEIPFLQRAFPYEEYDPTQGKPPFMPLPSYDWYKPQGQVAEKDYFSEAKLQEAIGATRKVIVKSDGLYMDAYFSRGYKLASQKLLDQERMELAKAEGYPKKDDTLASLLDLVARGGRGGTHMIPEMNSPSHAEGQVASNPSALTTESNQPEASVSGTLRATEAAVDTNASTVQESATDMPSAVTALEITPSAPVEAVTDEEPKLSKPTKMDYYQVNAFLSTLFTAPTENPLQKLGPGACRILQTMMTGLESRVFAMGCHLQRQALTKILVDIEAQMKEGREGREKKEMRIRKEMAGDRNPYSRRGKMLDLDAYALDMRFSGSVAGSPIKSTREGTPITPARDAETPMQEAGSLSALPSEPASSLALGHQQIETTTSVPEATPALPSVANPLQINLAMDPFLLARDFVRLKKMQELRDQRDREREEQERERLLQIELEKKHWELRRLQALEDERERIARLKREEDRKEEKELRKRLRKQKALAAEAAAAQKKKQEEKERGRERGREGEKEREVEGEVLIRRRVGQQKEQLGSASGSGSEVPNVARPGSVSADAEMLEPLVQDGSGGDEASEAGSSLAMDL